MSSFLGIGLGPIQTGIFLAGAAKGKFDRIVIAEVDDKLKNAINNSGGTVTVNIAADDRVYCESYANVEVYNPLNDADLEKLIEAAADADELATALPSVNFFDSVAKWLRTGFSRTPDKRRFIYTAENNNHAAEEFEKAMAADFANTFYLNTVVGKMSGVVPAGELAEQNLEPLCPGADRGHLVEQFDRILISSASGIEERQTLGLHVKTDLYPFEEAKLYGHNAIHFLLGILGKQHGKEYMSELRDLSGLMAKARQAFIDECGAALCKKWAGTDELFTPQGFLAYAEDLLIRMTNPFLKDAIARITRDIPRKISWNDRIVGTMRVALAQDVSPAIIATGAALAAREQYGDKPEEIKAALRKVWPAPWTDEHDAVFNMIINNI